MKEIIQYEGEEPRIKKKSESIDSSKQLLFWNHLPEASETQPAFDVSTQKLKAYYAVQDGKWTRKYQVVDLSDAEKLSKLETDAETAFYNNGFDTGKGYKLALKESDRNAFTQLMVLLQSSGVPPEHVVKIKDIDGNIHDITYAELVPLIIQYGLYFQNAWQKS